MMEPMNCPWDPVCSEGYCHMPSLYQVEEVRSLAKCIIERCVDGHPFGKVAVWCIYNIPYEIDRVVWGVPDYWTTPLEVLDVKLADCEGLSYLVASMLLSLGYQAYVVVGDTPWGYHAWVEALDEWDRWIVIEATLGVLLTINDRDRYGYAPDFFVTPEGCFRGSPADCITPPGATIESY